MLTGAVVPASAVASMPIRPTVRPSMRPNPVTTPSPGTFFPVRRSGCASMPVSNQEPSSRSSVIRSRTGSQAGGAVPVHRLLAAHLERLGVPPPRLGDALAHGGPSGQGHGP